MKPARKRSGFARNAAANWFAFLFTAVVGFFLSPYVVDHLGPTKYGVWTLIGGLVGYLGLLDLGIRQAVNRFIAKHFAAGEHEESSLIVSAALRLFGILGVAAIVLSCTLAALAPSLFNIPPELVEDARTIIVLGGVTIAFSLVSGVFGGVLTGLERFDIYNVLEIFVTSARTAATVLALHEGYGLVMLAAIGLASALLNFGILWVAMNRLYGDLRVRLSGPLGSHIRTILAFSASLTVLYAVSRIIFYSDALVIGAFLPIEAVTFFAIAGSLSQYAKEMARSLSYVMTPRVSALTSVGESRVGELIVAVARLATLASVPVAITFLLRGESFIGLWMGSAYGPLSGQVLRVLAIVVWLDASRSVIIASLTGMAQQRQVIPGIVIEAALNLALSLALVHSLGIVGVALGTLIPNVIVGMAYLPHRLRRATGAPLLHYYRQVILLPLVTCIPFAIATYAFERLAPATNLFWFFLQVAAVLPLVPAAAWFLCLSGEEKDRVKYWVANLRGRTA